MKKQISVLILITSLLLALTACTGSQSTASDNTDTSDSSVVSEKPGSEAPAEEVDPDAPITEEMVRNHPVAPAEDFSYDITENGVRMGSYKGTDPIVVVPTEIEGKPVTEYYDLAFGNDSPVRAVLIPESVTVLGEVFTNNKTVELVICEGVTKFMGLTFGNCPSLRQVILGKNVQELAGIGTFGACPKLEELHFTAALTKIGSEEFTGKPTTFMNCDSLIIYGPAGSFIETFAKENGVPFEVE